MKLMQKIMRYFGYEPIRPTRIVPKRDAILEGGVANGWVIRVEEGQERVIVPHLPENPAILFSTEAAIENPKMKQVIYRLSHVVYREEVR